MRALGKDSVASVVKVVLTIAWWGLWIGLFALILAALGYGLLQLMIASGWIDGNILTGGGGKIRVGDGSDFDLTYTHPGGATWPVVAPAFVIGGVAIVGGLVIVGRLRLLFDSFTSGEPFRRENAAHLRVIWIAMLAIEVSRYILLAMIAALFAATGVRERANVDFNLNVDFSTWMSIAILIVLAEVFREGARMKEEQELTI